MILNPNSYVLWHTPRWWVKANHYLWKLEYVCLFWNLIRSWKEMALEIRQHRSSSWLFLALALLHVYFFCLFCIFFFSLSWFLWQYKNMVECWGGRKEIGFLLPETLMRDRTTPPTISLLECVFHCFVSLQMITKMQTYKPHLRIDFYMYQFFKTSLSN